MVLQEVLEVVIEEDFKKIFFFLLTNMYFPLIMNNVHRRGQNNFIDGEVAQLARAFGSYPTGRRFESTLRYQTENCSENGQFFIV